MSQLTGKTIGKYQVIELLSDEGDRLVCKGFEPTTNRYILFTVLKPEAASDPENVRRFLEIGELAAKMQHPNILPIYDSEQRGQLAYRVSPYFENGTLRTQIMAYRDPTKALGLVRGVAAGLAYIHSQGTIDPFPLRPGHDPEPHLSERRTVQRQPSAPDRCHRPHSVGSGDTQHGNGPADSGGKGHDRVGSGGRWLPRNRAAITIVDRHGTPQDRGFRRDEGRECPGPASSRGGRACTQRPIRKKRISPSSTT